LAVRSRTRSTSRRIWRAVHWSAFWKIGPSLPVFSDAPVYVCGARHIKWQADNRSTNDAPAKALARPREALRPDNYPGQLQQFRLVVDV
jgi:hypothetical protein